jgi:hypothetical protein
MGAWINSAIVHLGADGTIFIPDGRYNFSTTIHVSQAQFQSLTIRCGSRSAVLNYTGRKSALYVTSNLNSAAQVSVENCSFWGTSAGKSANGFSLYDAWNFRSSNDYLYGFKHLGVSCTGCIDAVFLNDDIVGAGSWNVKLTTDRKHSINSNANEFIGGSIVYGGAGNIWDAGEGDELNSFRGVTLEESLPVPQVLMEGVTNDAVANAYVEYTQHKVASRLCSIVLGNHPQSGWGSDASYTARFVRLTNLYMATPRSSGGNLTANVCFFNSTYSFLEGIHADGSPQYGAYFYPDGNILDNTIGPSSLGYQIAQYNRAPPGNLLWVPYGTSPAEAEWTYGRNGAIEYGAAGVKTYKTNGVAGFTGVKKAGSCVFTVKSGIITRVSGC